MHSPTGPSSREDIEPSRRAPSHNVGEIAEGIDGAYGQFLPRNVKNIYERIAIIPPDDPRQKWYNTTGGVPYDKDLPEEEYQKDWHLLGLEAVK